MLSRAALAIGLIFCTTHTNTYILLSANIEDIRKVASKFLSPDVVEKLTDLVNKLHKEVKINLSEENKVNEASINRISEDELDRVRSRTTHGIVRSERKKPKYLDKTKTVDTQLGEDKTKKVDKQLREDKTKKVDKQLREDKTKKVDKQLREDKTKKVDNQSREDDRGKNKLKQQKKANREKEGDLYWNDIDNERFQEQRIIATSGRMKMPRFKDARQTIYDWQQSESDD